jgi:hypothetical protein
MLLCSPVSVSLCLHLLAFLIFCFSLQEHLNLPLLSHCLAAHILALSVLLPFMLCAPSPFNAPFLFSVFQLLHTPPSTRLNHSQQQQHSISSLFFILIVSVHLLHALSTMFLHALTMSSALPDHHCNSSASLAVPPMHPSSLGVMPRFLSLSCS